jgi:hypothetical protein
MAKSGAGKLAFLFASPFTSPSLFPVNGCNCIRFLKQELNPLMAHSFLSFFLYTPPNPNPEPNIVVDCNIGNGNRGMM